MTDNDAREPDTRDTPPVVRRAARVLLIDSDERILLFRCSGEFSDGNAIWLTPGGGLAGAESFEQAAARELFEETGLRADVGRCVWTRRHVFPMPGRIEEAREQFYVVRCAPFAPDTSRWEPAERAEITDVRWWSATEIAAATDEVFVPRRLAALLPPLLRGELPAAPVDCGV